jgi:hypothetical protein
MELYRNSEEEARTLLICKSLKMANWRVFR